ncbi:MAG: hypothetical protein CBC42_07755 [Betaproteobacteria bacterium TMED82]|nr:MAG: hypothetical protein CBC42_07755 [Betaproteobacteria bacterium TMED82]|tara:strand:- start:11362 stop:11847 length:486 start_codon:yes stop_codon:yes gene_type:complete
MSKNFFQFVSHFLTTTLGLWTASVIFDGFQILNLEALAVSGLLLALINLFIKPIIFLLAFPLALVSFGLIVPILNGAFLLLISELIGGFNIDSFWTSILAGIIVSAVSIMLNVATGNYKSSVSLRKNSISSSHKSVDKSYFSSGKSRSEESVIDVEVKEKK